MSSTPIDRALDILRERGHEVATKPGAFKGPDGQTLVTIDGQLRTFEQIYEMVAAPTTAFENPNFENLHEGTETKARCKHCGAVMNSADTAAHVCAEVDRRMQLSLVPMNGSRRHGEAGFDVVYTYNVLGLPDGHGAHIQNLDYPRAVWSIQRLRDGVPEEKLTGNYQSPEDALAKLQEEYTK